MTIFNVHQITDRISSSGQPSRDEFQHISDAGYEVVINLAMPDHEKSISDEGAVITALGMSYIHIPVPFDSPKECHYTEFSSYMDALRNKKVWVHYIVNARVSAFLFRYLQDSRGFTPAQATTPILEQWLPQMDDVWKAFISRAPGQL
ncbi:protein tyrosine phosphatase family protein [Pseudoteredinibacter isoporae]|uniref:protein tyrosine phosphatase family protein n=1 Tax=Pseudoteredinibacter isoporae TaxID=570281 RepID=UPI003102BB4C